MFNRALTPEQKQGLANYKFYPPWIAPNLLTLLGFLAIVTCFLLITVFNPDLTRPNSVPSWAWFTAGLLVFTCQTLDGTDGKQARRTGTSSPLGELLDHCIDSWTCYFLVLSTFALLGDSYSPVVFFVALWIVLICFFVPHWQKHILGVFHLPWSYDMGHVPIFILFVLVSIFSPALATRPLLFNLSIARVCFFLLGVTLLAQLPSSIYLLLASKSSSDQPWHRGLGWIKGLIEPWLPTCLLLTFSTLWALTSPADLLNHSPTLFFYCFATLQTNIACELIVAILCKVQPPRENWLAIHYSLMVTVNCLLIPVQWTVWLDYYLLVYLSVLVTCVHLIQATTLIRSIATHLGIQVFTITPSVQSLTKPHNSPLNVDVDGEKAEKKRSDN